MYHCSHSTITSLSLTSFVFLSMDSVFSTILIILAILFITFMLSLMLRFLQLRINRRRLLSDSTPPRSPPPLTTIVTESPPASLNIDSLPPIPFHFTSDSTPPSSQPPQPAPEIQRAIDSLPTFHFSSISTTATATADCAVCLTAFSTTDLLRALPRCCHAFHSDCIDNWLRSSNLSCCPLCRSTIFASESDLAAIIRSPSDSFRVEIGNVTYSEAVGGDALSSYSVGGSFDYRVMEVSQVPVSAVSSRTGSFRGSGRFFGGSSRRIEANRIGEEITEMFRWLSGDY